MRAVPVGLGCPFCVAKKATCKKTDKEQYCNYLEQKSAVYSSFSMWYNVDSKMERGRIMKRTLTGILIGAIIVLTGAMMASADNAIVSTADFSTTSFDAVTDKAYISFYLTANEITDGVIGITESQATPTYWDQYGISMSIGTDGVFNVYNSTGFTRMEEVNYIPGEAHFVEIVADVKANTYDAYVTVGGQKYALAENYGFRKACTDLGKITVRGGLNVAAGKFQIEDFEVEDGGGMPDDFLLPNFIRENMVLQRNVPHVIYGKANSGAGEITVTLERGDMVSEAVAEVEDGRFKAELDPLPASLDGYTLTVQSENKTVVVNNVFIGDVFLLAGQSNMEQNYNWQKNQMGGGVTTQNMPTLYVDDRVKYFAIRQQNAAKETFNIPFLHESWEALSAENVNDLSYIGMFLARERLKEEPDVPIGLLSTAWGGSNINSWIRKSEDNKTTNYADMNGNIYNNHIAPLTNYPVKAFLWYQGESNSYMPMRYKEAMKALIIDWRNLWGDDDIPFFLVQLARYQHDNYSQMRQSQLEALELKNVGMVVTLDTDKGTYSNIHPLGKDEIAKRMNLLVKRYAHGEDVVAEGPIIESVRRDGAELVISFREDTIGDGLTVKNPYGSSTTKLAEFEIASQTGDFVAAEAVINEDNTVSVSAFSVAEPVYVRYAYSKVPNNPNLFNKNGLPASPFTTDVRRYSADSFASVAYEAGDEKVQVAEFTVCAVKDNIDGVIGITDNRNNINAWNNCGVTIVMNSDGKFQYVDGGNVVVTDISYEKNKLYNIVVTADFTKNTYSLEIDGVKAGENIAFRQGSLEMNNLGRSMFRGGGYSGANDFFGLNYCVSAPEAKISSEIMENGDIKISVEIFTGEEASVYLASYNGEEMVKAEKVISGTTEGGEYTLAAGAEASEMKVIVITEDSLRPLCEAKSIK